MDLLGTALPNVMFIIGILAIGLGLGIELKIISLNKEIDKTGRIGALVVGVILIGASITMYLNPSLGNRGQQSSAAPNAAQVAPAQAKTVAATGAPAATSAALAPVVPAQMTVPTQAAAPISTPVLEFVVPDLHDLSEKDAQNKLVDAHLKPHKADHCVGANQGDQKAKKGRIMCQNPPAGQKVASGMTVDYVLAGK